MLFKLKLKIIACWPPLLYLQLLRRGLDPPWQKQETGATPCATVCNVCCAYSTICTGPQMRDFSCVSDMFLPYNKTGRKNILWANKGPQNGLFSLHRLCSVRGSVVCWRRLGSSTWLRRKRSKDPCTCSCAGTRLLIQVEIEAALGFPMPRLCPSHHGKSQPCPRQGQNKCQCPEFLLHVETQAFGSCRQLLLDCLSRHPDSFACSWLPHWQNPCGCWPCGC